MAVAMAAYEMGYARACRSIVEPTNASRRALAGLLPQLGFRTILGQGYYAFIDVGPWLRRMGLPDSEPLGQLLAERHGLAVVPGAFFSPYGGDWIRFSYATPVDKTVGAARRLAEALDVLAGA
jgi:aspartate/methionine/tyrosine aminotransferase